MKKFDITVIGSGPGGYVAAIRSAQLGYKVAIVEKYPVLGGTCTNVGCIPSKALLDSSEHYHSAQIHYAAHGIDVQQLSLNFPQFMERKKQVVSANNDGLEYLMKKNRITVFNGTGRLISENVLEITGASDIRIESNYFIIATGSKPATIPGLKTDKKRIITSTEALSLKNIPKSMLIVGGGIIGVELASVYARIGTKVTILEYTDSLIPAMDKDLGKALRKILKKLGIEIHLNAKVSQAMTGDQSVKTLFQDIAGNTQQITSEYVLVAAGRKPYTEGLGLENLNIRTDAKGFITVNPQLQTSQSNIYAIGDVIGGAMLAHKAEDEGTFVAETIDGQKPHINYRLIPGVVYTWPEVASVGFTENELKEKEMPYRSGRFPFSILGRSRAAGEKDGFVKILSDPKYGELLGVHIVGPRAADLIAQAVVAMEYEMTDEDLVRISYAHPTYSEALKEAYLDASGIGTINM